MRNVLIISNSFRAKTIGVIGKTFSPECGVSGGGWWLGSGYCVWSVLTLPRFYLPCTGDWTVDTLDSGQWTLWTPRLFNSAELLGICLQSPYTVELQTKVHTKVRNTSAFTFEALL